ncbi:unnamed protein product [Closterium sp. Yama58-4]|nr:unnamed protein product [Closterium sp. Yama58-4]
MPPAISSVTSSATSSAMPSRVKRASASSHITLLSVFIAGSALMPSGCWAQNTTMNATFHSDFFQGDVRIIVGPYRNKFRVEANMPDWAKSATLKQEYIVETYPFPSNFSSLTDAKHATLTFAPSNCYPLSGSVTPEQAVPAYLASGPDLCLSCYVYLTFSFLDPTTASQIGSTCTETDNGKLRGYICSTATDADVAAVAQAFGEPPIMGVGGTSVGFLYTEMFVRQPAGSTMRVPSIRVDPLAMKGIGYIMVPSTPKPLPGTFDALPFVAGNNSKSISVGLVIPISLMTQASVTTTPISSVTRAKVAADSFLFYSMDAPANQSLTVDAVILPPDPYGIASVEDAKSYSITLYISKKSTGMAAAGWGVTLMSVMLALLTFLPVM